LHRFHCDACGLGEGAGNTTNGITYLAKMSGWPLLVGGLPVSVLAERMLFRRWLSAEGPGLNLGGFSASSAPSGVDAFPDSFLFGGSHWEVVEKRPRPMAFRKRAVERDLDGLFGPANWKFGWRWLDGILDCTQALALYESAYIHHLRAQTETLDWLCDSASDVYDWSTSNMNSGEIYDMSDQKAAHYQDVAVRVAVRVLGRHFQGDHPVQIRGKDSEGYRLNPGHVPFHLPWAIRQPETCQGGADPRNWWDKGSVESFWQNNRVLLHRVS